MWNSLQCAPAFTAWLHVYAQKTGLFFFICRAPKWSWDAYWRERAGRVAKLRWKGHIEERESKNTMCLPTDHCGKTGWCFFERVYVRVINIMQCDERARIEDKDEILKKETCKTLQKG